MFEHYRQQLIPRSAFARRMLICIFIAASLIIITILIGASIFCVFGKYMFVDAILNSVTVMMGVGITGPLSNPALKILIAFYAIFSGIIYFSVLAILFAPLLHRFLHRFHIDIEHKK